MVKDYKNGNSTPRGGTLTGHPLAIGIIIGFVLGMGVAFGFAIYINRTQSPFMVKEFPATKRELKPMDVESKDKRAQKEAANAPKPEFDFYEILPGKREAMPETASAVEKAPDRIYLQAGAFQNSADADNLKARLALAGFESQIQTAHLPNHKVWHRVRLGPYVQSEEAQRVQSALKDNQIQATLIRSKE
jgi:cell division protein FtsN